MTEGDSYMTHATERQIDRETRFLGVGWSESTEVKEHHDHQ